MGKLRFRIIGRWAVLAYADELRAIEAVARLESGHKGRAGTCIYQTQVRGKMVFVVPACSIPDDQIL